jgi:hypothetical protein
MESALKGGDGSAEILHPLAPTQPFPEAAIGSPQIVLGQPPIHGKGFSCSNLERILEGSDGGV